MVVLLKDEFLDDPKVLCQSLADCIEDIERTLNDDEDFCEQDIAATYAAAVNHVQSLEDKLRARLDELRHELDRMQEVNRTTSEKHRKQLHERIEAVNHAFTSDNYRQG